MSARVDGALTQAMNSKPEACAMTFFDSHDSLPYAPRR
jgi:hypothetical protein